MIEFILARYNYWIVIILMLTGLYIVFSRGNLVKTVVGLNLFQTSVFIFYITLGDVVGGTAPILPYPNPDKGHGDDGHGDDTHAAPHDSAAHVQGTNEVPADAVPTGQEHTGAMSQEDAEAYLSGERANDLAVNSPGNVDGSDLPTESLHDLPELNAVNTLEPNAPAMIEQPAEQGITITHGSPEAAAAAAADAHNAGAEAVHGVAETIYSNPLPHVLILTAIVVGVATTAVGLALAVRIREAYGTIEEDALEKIDNEAATGSPYGEGGST